MRNKRVYLDYNASTPLAPEVVEAMRPLLASDYGNPSSRHWAGAPAKEALERARVQVAALLGCRADEIVFTSGGTEANNHALKGIFFAQRQRGNHIIATQVEHPAITAPCRFLETLGAEVTYLPVDETGRVDPDDLRKALTAKTVLITVMHANNEVGTIQPIADIGRIARDHGILFHTDAAQSVGKIPAHVDALNVDLLSLAGHKVYAPKGVGALYLRNGVKLEPFMHGASHESGRRAGTENILLDVALGAACELAQQWIGMPEVQKLRDALWQRLQAMFGGKVHLNGHPTERLPNTLNVSWVGRSGSELLAQLPEIAASTGSACHEGQVKMSPVLQALGLSPNIGMGAIRFSLGRSTTLDDIQYTLTRMGERIRSV